MWIATPSSQWSSAAIPRSRRPCSGSGKCNVLVVADAKELAGLVTDLPADAGIDPAIEQQIDQHLGRPVEALNQRDEILAVLR
jgi:hypothetical protein